jgi:HEAT repeat protein
MAFDLATLDAPFTALKAFNWGSDANAFKPIDAAVVAAHGDAALRAELEKRFGQLLADDSSRATKEYVCRKLAMIGTSASVSALATLLPSEDHSHMSRFALERIGAPEAAEALRTALGKVEGTLKIGMISSLAARGDKASVPAIGGMLGGDAKIAAAAAEALGTLRTPEAAAALAGAKADGDVAAAITDARLACAESFLAKGDRAAAKAIYESINAAVGAEPKTHRKRAVRVAAKRGLLATAE